MSVPRRVVGLRAYVGPSRSSGARWSALAVTGLIASSCLAGCTPLVADEPTVDGAVDVWTTDVHGASDLPFDATAGDADSDVFHASGHQDGADLVDGLRDEVDLGSREDSTAHPIPDTAHEPTGDDGAADGLLPSFDAADRETDGEAPRPALPLSIHRSLLESNYVVLAPFTIQRVFQRLASTSTTPELLYQSLFLKFLPTEVCPQCGCTPEVNGYPNNCNLFVNLLVNEMGRWRPLSLVNRFDRAPEYGEDCGEQHLTFYFRKPPDADVALPERAYLRWSAVIENPHKELGLEGCRPIAEFWQSLSDDRMADPARRSRQLEIAFFGEPDIPHATEAQKLDDEALREKLKGFRPFVSPEHFGRRGRVQMLAFADINAQRAPVHYFFEFAYDGGDFVRQAVTQSFAVGPLLVSPSSYAHAESCRDDLVDSVPLLVPNDLSLQRINVRPECFASASSTDDVRIDHWLLANPGDPLYNRIQQKIVEASPAGSPLTVAEIGWRAHTAGTCVGCHSLSDASGQRTITFAHVDESRSLPCADVGFDHGQSCYAHSDSLRSLFLPHRLSVLRRYLEHPHEYQADPTHGESAKNIDGTLRQYANP